MSDLSLVYSRGSPNLIDIYPMGEPFPIEPIKGFLPSFLEEYLAPRPESILNHAHFRTINPKMVILEYVHKDENEISMPWPQKHGPPVSPSQSLEVIIEELVTNTECHCIHAHDTPRIYRNVRGFLRACLYDATERFLYNEDTTVKFKQYDSVIDTFEDMLFENLNTHLGFDNYRQNLDLLIQHHGKRFREPGYAYHHKNPNTVREYMRLKLVECVELTEIDLFIIASIYHAKVRIWRVDCCHFSTDQCHDYWLYKTNEYNFNPIGMENPPEWDVCFEPWRRVWYNMPNKITAANDHSYSAADHHSVDSIVGLLVSPIKPLLK